MDQTFSIYLRSDTQPLHRCVSEAPLHSQPHFNFIYFIQKVVEKLFKNDGYILLEVFNTVPKEESLTREISSYSVSVLNICFTASVSV